ncbi:MAG TPA: hypothetical protein VMW23_00905 [Sedimentisphaerales bacterium]|nr:hypothetical protein [Sedimentisphaerales bacterium]
MAFNLERTLSGLKPVYLTVPGIAAVLAGLFLWLGGLGLRIPLVTLLGAVSGGALGWLVIGKISAVAILAVLAAAAAVFFERIFIIVLTAILAAACGFVVLAGPYVNGADNLSKAILNASGQIPLYIWLAILAVTVTVLAVGFLFRRLISALCCASLGAMLIFAGMIVLLVYKGTMPLSYINSRPLFYAGVFAAMVAFGTTEQLLLWKLHITQSNPKKHKTDDNCQQTGRQSINWRSF